MIPGMTIEQHIVWAKDHMLWYEEPTKGPKDTGPKHRHFVRALLILLVEHNFMVDMKKVNEI